MKQSIVVLVYYLLSTEAFNSFRPTRKQLDHARKRASANKPTPKPPAPPEPVFQLPKVPDLPDEINPITPSVWNSMTSAALGLASKLAPKSVRQNSDRAARITVNRLPPTSIQVDLSDVPLIGPALSGTYAKVDKLKSKPSVVIASPREKLGAISEAVETGQLEFGMSGLLQSSLDIELEPNKPGIAPVQLKSPLIPKWPFGRRRSDWYRVQNLGDGEIYYFNDRTGETSPDEPNSIH